MNNDCFQVNYGWVCPKCGGVYGPMQMQCTRCNADLVNDIKPPQEIKYEIPDLSEILKKIMEALNDESDV